MTEEAAPILTEAEEEKRLLELIEEQERLQAAEDLRLFNLEQERLKQEKITLTLQANEEHLNKRQYWLVDWSKVSTIQDLITILKHSRLYFSGPISDFPEIEPFVYLTNDKP